MPADVTTVLARVETTLSHLTLFESLGEPVHVGPDPQAEGPPSAVRHGHHAIRA